MPLVVRLSCVPVVCRLQASGMGGQHVVDSMFLWLSALQGDYYRSWS